MTERKAGTKSKWIDPDDAPQLTAEVAGRAQIAIGGKVVRVASGTFTRRGRPPIGDQPKQQVTLRLPREVIAHFKAGGPGWQSRIGTVLAHHANKDKRGSA